MGGTAWSASSYADRVNMRAASGASTFGYSDAMASTPSHARAAHDTLKPFGVKIRESRDSDVHPESLAIAVFCDVTGSMRRVPSIMQKNLPKLMALLISKGYVEHPQIMIGAIGDATSDRVPLQVGEFESGIEIADNLTNLYLEGGGGGSSEESYELAAYFLARHTSMDCLEKRGKRGYAFIIGDEKPYSQISPSQVEKIIGDTLQAPIQTSELFKELDEKFDVYFIFPNMTNHWGDKRVEEVWQDLVGQRLLKLDQPESICELIASTIGLAEGIADIDSLSMDLASAGVDASGAASVTRALATVGAGGKKGDELTVADSGAASGVGSF